MPDKVTPETAVMLNAYEREQLKRYAKAEGITEEEAANRLVSDGIARRLRRNTGKGPARVYPIKKQ